MPLHNHSQRVPYQDHIHTRLIRKTGHRIVIGRNHDYLRVVGLLLPKVQHSMSFWQNRFSCLCSVERLKQLLLFLSVSFGSKGWGGSLAAQRCLYRVNHLPTRDGVTPIVHILIVEY